MKSKLIQRGDCSKAQEDYYSYHDLFLNQEEEKKTRSWRRMERRRILEIGRWFVLRGGGR